MRRSALLLAVVPVLALAAAPALHVSKQFDVRIHPAAPCTGDDACIGPATLTFTARGAHAIPALHVETLKLDSADVANVRINDAQMYGEQSTLIAGDFNFDGHDDLAVRTGDDGPYGGPTYAVYIFDRTHGHFVEDGALGGLTYDTLGMFGVDTKRHRITTWTKSGCCWHEYVEYTNDAKGLVAVYRRTVDAMRDPMTITEERLDAHGRWHTKKHREPIKE